MKNELDKVGRDMPIPSDEEIQDRWDKLFFAALDIMWEKYAERLMEIEEVESEEMYAMVDEVVRKAYKLAKRTEKMLTSCQLSDVKEDADDD